MAGSLHVMNQIAQTADIERVLGRVVVGYRVVGAAWLGILGIITLAGSADPGRPSVVVATVVGVGGWALLTGWLHGRHPRLLRTWWWLAADVGVTIWALFSSDVAGTTSTFYGGYPMSTVFMGVYSFAIAGGLATAAALSAATVLRLIESAGSDPTNDSAAVLIYLFGGVLAGWAVGVIRRSDRLRREAEEALVEERASRARAEERSEMAAHLHDSVLQTLAMVQRTEKPEETVALARRQERELRSWLFGDGTASGDTFGAAVRAMTAEVEELYPVRIQTVVVGDATLDAGLEALIKAGREASVNAAHHAGVEEFSVYAEVRQGVASIFVRDRGSGFDPDTVPSNRGGIVESIVGRMQRHGGSVAIRSTPGGGTEVVLEQEVRA
jgi:signal transduction histidine kinase